MFINAINLNSINVSCPLYSKVQNITFGASGDSFEKTCVKEFSFNCSLNKEQKKQLINSVNEIISTNMLIPPPIWIWCYRRCL